MQMDNKNNVLFHEVQRFSALLRLFAVISMLCSIGLAAYGLWLNLSSHITPSLSSLATTAIPGFIIPGLLIALLIFMKLETFVYSDCLCFRFFPFHISFKKFTKAELTECSSCTYNPIREFGGWGIRCGSKRHAYNINGNRGVQITLKDGKRLLIGSQKADDFSHALNSMS
ncbi:MAG: hypothetical protein JW749_09375 [Sedimentisphaerales bacterium]|nr:hypothetical protein [Sedimentisphaerales bacterium]